MQSHAETHMEIFNRINLVTEEWRDGMRWESSLASELLFLTLIYGMRSAPRVRSVRSEAIPKSFKACL